MLSGTVRVAVSVWYAKDSAGDDSPECGKNEHINFLKYAI